MKIEKWGHSLAGRCQEVSNLLCGEVAVNKEWKITQDMNYEFYSFLYFYLNRILFSAKINSSAVKTWGQSGLES